MLAHPLRIAGLLGALAVTFRGDRGHADTVTIVADRDNTLVESATGHISGGLLPWFFAGNTNQGPDQNDRRSLMRFDLSSIPPGSTINSAGVRLYMSRSVLAGPNDYTLHRVLADWGEGTTSTWGGQGGGQGGFSTALSATWIHRFSPDVLWTKPGGDFDRSPSATLNVAGEASYTWTSPQLAADVQEWVVSPARNFGWLLKGPEEELVPTAKRFESREARIAADRPTVIIEYTPPSTTCPPDVAPRPMGNGQVDADDLVAVILSWGPCMQPCPPCAADVDGNCTTDADDLVAVILAWGPCPADARSR